MSKIKDDRTYIRSVHKVPRRKKKLETYLVNTAIMQFKISKGVAGSRDISMV